jgi:Kef-type K+ transport system membrane component KefB
MQSWLAGVALSTTSVAVVYAVMLEYGLNKTEYGKIVLAHASSTTSERSLRSASSLPLSR